MIEIADPDPRWPGMAEAEAVRWRDALGPALAGIHHIGSTSVPGLAAKPIIDLLPVLRGTAELDGIADSVRALGYDWLGEFGLPRRRYARRDDPQTGRRLIQAHCYSAGDPEITRHLAFRDHLRRTPALAAEYAGIKRDCAARFPEDGTAYGACKSDWIDRIEAEALTG